MDIKLSINKKLVKIDDKISRLTNLPSYILFKLETICISLSLSLKTVIHKSKMNIFTGNFQLPIR